MVEIDAIYTGPAIAKTEAQVPDNIVGQIIDEVGDAKNIKEIVKIYVARSRDDLELADINAKTTCLYAWNRVTQRSTKSSPRNMKARAKARSAAVAKQASKMVEAIRAVCVMDLILPTGKCLRESTFAQCKAAGGLFMRIAAKGKPNQVVGKVLTDKQAQTLWTGK